MTLIEEGVDKLADYATVPIGFEVRSRVCLSDLRASPDGPITVTPEEPHWKDYDAYERPTALPARFDMSNWLIVSAFDGERRLGGVIAARDTLSCDMLDGRTDLVVPFDVRVHPTARGQGVGRALFEHVIVWARANGCTELRVETQDVNVVACRFYLAMGCQLHSAQEGAYGPELDEAMVIWRLRL